MANLNFLLYNLNLLKFQNHFIKKKIIVIIVAVIVSWFISFEHLLFINKFSNFTVNSYT